MEEMTRSEVNKIWENLTIADNFIFQKVMRKKRLCKRFIEKILHIKIRKIMFPETEKGIKRADKDDISLPQLRVELALVKHIHVHHGLIIARTLRKFRGISVVGCLHLDIVERALVVLDVDV